MRLLVAAWIALAAGGLTLLARYKGAPGSAAEAPRAWASHLARSPGRPVLLMLAHPMCPCTRASLAELKKLAEDLGGAVDLNILFIRPAETGDAWAKSDLWALAREVPGATVLEDVDGREAARFGAATSGQVLLYDEDGKLAFHGGITLSRGHEGDSPGRERIRARLQHRAALESAPVFGCALNDPHPNPPEGAP